MAKPSIIKSVGTYVELERNYWFNWYNDFPYTYIIYAILLHWKEPTQNSFWCHFCRIGICGGQILIAGVKTAVCCLDLGRILNRLNTAGVVRTRPWVPGTRCPGASCPSHQQTFLFCLRKALITSLHGIYIVYASRLRHTTWILYYYTCNNQPM